MNKFLYILFVLIFAYRQFPRPAVRGVLTFSKGPNMPPVTHLPYDEPVVATLSGVDKNGNPANFDSSVNPTWTISGIDGATDIVSADKLSAKVSGNKAGKLNVSVDLGSLPAAKGDFTFDPLPAVSGQVTFSSEDAASTPPSSETPPTETPSAPTP